MAKSQTKGQSVGGETISLVDEIISDAIRARASDIHFEPQEDAFVVRVRVDGQLRVRRRIALDQMQAVCSRIKVMGGLDLTERRLPQDGRIRFEKYSRPFDLRVGSAPMVEGEKIVLRVINTQLSQLKIEDIGYSPENLRVYKSLISMPNGLVLHCGPTGSGKTTALYTALNFLNEEKRNIQTIEDPVEVRMAGLNQAQVHTEYGVTFASLLRAYLRQDCDVILVGEIRDTETANLAVQAALTGHLILGTLHCNSAVGAISRLEEMEVPSFFVATALNGVIYQYLVRRLCLSCREPYLPVEKIARALNVERRYQIYRAKGCRACGRSGYKGRLLIQEVLKLGERARKAVHDGMTGTEVQKIAYEEGLIPIFEDGLSKVRDGHTSVEEVARVVKGVNLGK